MSPRIDGDERGLENWTWGSLTACAKDSFLVAATAEGKSVAYTNDFEETTTAEEEISACAVGRRETRVASSACQSNMATRCSNQTDACIHHFQDNLYRSKPNLIA